MSIRDEVRSVALMWLGGATASTERLANAILPLIEAHAAAREAAAVEREREALSGYLKPEQTPLERIEQDHKDILGLMKLLQLEKEKQTRLAADVQQFVRHETTDAFRLRKGIANVRKMLGRSRAVSIAAKRELDAELLRLLGADNDTPDEPAAPQGRQRRGVR
jgi:hypothetical protein